MGVIDIAQSASAHPIFPPPSHPVPMSPSPWTKQLGQPEGAGSGNAPESGEFGIAADPCPPLWWALWTAMRVPGAKMPLPLGLHTPLPAQPVPEGSQRVGMGPRDQARWLPPDGPKGWQPGQALYPTRLRLERQISLDSRGAAIPAGPLHHRGR
jgi:hypothetical protein